MASVYQKVRGGTWYAQYVDGHGRRRQVATKAATKTAAQRLADDLERQAERQRLGVEKLPTNCPLTVGELCDWWLKRRCPAASTARERNRLTYHVINRRLGKLLVKEVTGNDVAERLREMEDEGCAPRTVNALRRVLHTVFNRAIEEQLWHGENPVRRVKPRKVQKPVFLTLKPEEVPRLLAAAEGPWRNILAAAVFTGMRKGELFGLRKANVDLDRKTITVAASYDRPTKGKHVDVVPIAEPLVPFLKDAIDSVKGELVFPNSEGKMRAETSHPERVLATALGRAGIVECYVHSCGRGKARGCGFVERHADKLPRACPRCGKKLRPKAIPKKLRFHDLRHTTATLLLTQGVPAYVVQKILRHKDVNLTLGTYGHLNLDDLRKGIAVLPGLPTVKVGSGGGGANDDEGREQQAAC